MTTDRVQSLIDAFIHELRAIILEDLLLMLQSELQPKLIVSPALPRQTKTTKRKGAKRAPAEIAAMTDRVYAYVQDHPGCSVEQIKKALKVDINEVTLPISKLLATKKIAKHGLKRATRYTAAKKVKGKK